ncbi:hypothetical protein [Namhaeicola litoreus]|uniref:TonB C-terminal domain-containing protein n=1 Tax=Namhaeicola litoreus TaxID=1052145 RepID=A0ABW3Y776_9FLAO
MKKVKILVLALALFAMNVSAATLAPVKPNAQLRADIVELIGPNCPYESDKVSCSAEVIFTINSEGEIVIISVNSENQDAEGFLKSKLNYKKVNFKPDHAGELFLLPLKMVKNS